MEDLTEGSVVRHLLNMAAFMAVSMLVQTLYLLADLYWVGRLGPEALAAVGVAGNLMMVVMALTQTVGVGTLLQFPLTTLGSALRATGIVKPGVAVQVLSVVLNMVLAPLFIFGIGPWPKLGVASAALATFISTLIADILMLIYFEKKYQYLRIKVGRPILRVWGNLLKIGLPAGAEFALLSINLFIVYGIIRAFGAAAQAGFGVGSRVMQAMFLPVVALSFAISPVIGQNFGARQVARVRQTVFAALGMASALMLFLAFLCWGAAPLFIHFFTNDPGVVAFGSEYLHVVAFNFVAAGLVFSSSSIFQGIGNTLPPLFCSAGRVLMFALPAVLLSHRPGFIFGRFGISRSHRRSYRPASTCCSCGESSDANCASPKTKFGKRSSFSC